MGCILTTVCSTDDDDDALLADDLKQHQRLSAASMPKRLTRTATQLLILDPLRPTAGLAKDATPSTVRPSARPDVVYGGGVPGVALDAAALASPQWTGAVDGGYASASGRLAWGAHTRAGCDAMRRRKENQDSFCVADRLADEPLATLFAVFDGHGPHGAHVSHFVRQAFHEHVAAAYREVVLGAKKSEPRRRASVGHDLMGDVFQRAARRVVDALSAKPALDLSVSGTTAVAVLVCDRDVFVAHVGDSRAVVASFAASENRYVVRHETRDHKPELPDERQRIEAQNGRVYEWGTFRVWLQDVDMPGLAMSRSFGDAVASTIGVTSDPEVVYVGDKIVHGDTAHPSFAVLASDGVWEFMSSDECVAFVGACLTDKKMTPQDACNALIAEATERWNKEEDVVDDITALVVCF